ncbi:insulin-like growth factor II [Polyodon spathula]|nr:insulin-like growth factor II [Polyodon spathula]
MEDHLSNNKHQAYCHNCIESGNSSNSIKVRKMSTSRQLLVFTIALTVYIVDVANSIASAETLCGGELVDTLQFVCGDRGFYFSKPPSRSNIRRTQKGIVEVCCYSSCDLRLLEMYCAKPAKSERDVSSTQFQVIPLALNKDVSKKPIIAKYSKYELWQKKAAQRLRRGVPSILKARKFRRHAEEIKALEQTRFHRPLITLPSKQPVTVKPLTENYTSKK